MVDHMKTALALKKGGQTTNSQADVLLTDPVPQMSSS